jgi:hypothetical protein
VEEDVGVVSLFALGLLSLDLDPESFVASEDAPLSDFSDPPFPAFEFPLR